jgi:hypothetical protein
MVICWMMMVMDGIGVCMLSDGCWTIVGWERAGVHDICQCGTHLRPRTIQHHMTSIWTRKSYTTQRKGILFSPSKCIKEPSINIAVVYRARHIQSWAASLGEQHAPAPRTPPPRTHLICLHNAHTVTRDPRRWPQETLDRRSDISVYHYNTVLWSVTEPSTHRHISYPDLGPAAVDPTHL